MTCRYVWRAGMYDAQVYMTYRYIWRTGIYDVQLYMTYSYIWRTGIYDVQVYMTYRYIWHTGIYDIQVYMIYRECQILLIPSVMFWVVFSMGSSSKERKFCSLDIDAPIRITCAMASGRSVIADLQQSQCCCFKQQMKPPHIIAGLSTSLC